jgi:hypothetical protein
MGLTGMANLSEYGVLTNFISEQVKGVKYPKILDVGCGRGLLGYILRITLTGNLQLHGIDGGVSDTHIPLLESVYTKFYPMKMQKYFKNGKNLRYKYDLIVANHVMEHLEEEEAYKYINKFQFIGKCVVLGFPRPSMGFEYGAEPLSFHSHKWGVDDMKMKKIGFRRVTSIRGNMVYSWT